MRDLADTNYKRDLTAAKARSQVRDALADKATVAYVMRRVAEGDSIKRIAASLSLDYYIFHRMLKANQAENLAAARAARAEELAEKNLTLADEIQEGLVEPSAGKAAAGIRQWYAERTDSENWGQKSSVDVNHKGVIGLHLEALQQFVDQPLEGEIEDAEYEEVEDGAEAEDEEPAASEEVPDTHPLL